jgi:hypothetical protein
MNYSFLVDTYATERLKTLNVGNRRWFIDWLQGGKYILIPILFTRNHTNGALIFAVPLVWRSSI